ncbi:O-antigen ligase family protein [Myroides sp. LJL119]
MNMILNNIKPRKRELTMTLFFISLLSEGVFLDIGFSLKLYMILFPFIVFYIIKNGVSKTLSFENSYILFSIYFVVGSFFTHEPFHSLLYSIVISFSVLGVLCFKSYLVDKSRLVIVERYFTNGIFWFSLLSLCMYIFGVFALNFNFYSAAGENVVKYGVMLDRSTPRLIGLGADPNNLVFASTLPWYFLLLKANKTRFEIVTFLMLTCCVILSFSRGGWLGIFIPAFLYFMVNFRRISLKYFFLVATFTISVIIYFYETLFKLLDEGISNRLDIGSGSGRFDLWATGLEVFENNFFFGLGANMFVFDYGKYVHNTYLQVLVDGGIFGFILFSLFLFNVFICIKKLCKYNYKGNVFLLISFYSILIQMFSLSILYNEAWILILGFVGFKCYMISYKKNAKRKKISSYSISVQE